MKAATAVPLRDIADLNPRLKASIEPDATVAFFPMSAISAEDGRATTVEERSFSEVSKGYTPFLSGDVLVAKITPCFENGKIAQIKFDKPFGFGSTEFHVIRPHSHQLDARYLLHYLRQERVRRDGEGKMTGSAGQRRVPEYFLSSLRVPLPVLPEQKRIARLLDRAETLRAKRRASIALLDSLASAVFVEMFGDPIANPNRWPVVTIGDLLESASYGTSEKAESFGQVPVLRMGNITASGEIDLSDLKFMQQSIADNDRYLVQPGDLLFNRTNSIDLVGKTAIFRGLTPMAYAGYLIRLRVNQKATADYLSAFLNCSYGKTVLKGMCKSIIGMANINATEVKSIRIPKPRMELQREFAGRLQKVRTVRSAFNESLVHLDELFSSLQHQAFNGKL